MSMLLLLSHVQVALASLSACSFSKLLCALAPQILLDIVRMFYFFTFWRFWEHSPIILHDAFWAVDKGLVNCNFLRIYSESKGGSFNIMFYTLFCVINNELFFIFILFSLPNFLRLLQDVSSMFNYSSQINSSTEFYKRGLKFSLCISFQINNEYDINTFSVKSTLAVLAKIYL